MNEPLVTIFTPVYNHEQYLDEYFESVINQTYRNIQLILIDDASPDQSKTVIEKWLTRLEERFENFTYIPREENKGLIYNCNESLELAKGKYIYAFASDDVMFKENIREKVDYLENNKSYAMVYSDGIYGEQNNLNAKKFSAVSNHYKGEVFELLINKGCFIPAPSAMVKKSVIVEAGGYSSKYFVEDYPLWVEIAYKHEIGYINKPLIFYRMVSNSLSHSNEGFEKLIKGHEMLYEDLSLKYKIDVAEALDNLYKMSMIHYYLKDTDRFKYYRKKIVKPNKVVRLLGITHFLKIPFNTLMVAKGELKKFKILFGK